MRAPRRIARLLVCCVVGLAQLACGSSSDGDASSNSSGDGDGDGDRPAEGDGDGDGDACSDFASEHLELLNRETDAVIVQKTPTHPAVE